MGAIVRDHPIAAGRTDGHAVEIREARPGDGEALLRVARAAIDALPPPATREFRRAFLARSLDFVGRRDGRRLVAELDAAVVGTVTLMPGSSIEPPEIRVLLVDPAVQRAGIGRALTEACLERARTDGRHEVVLHTAPMLSAAVALYERMGFVRDMRLDVDATADFGPLPDGRTFVAIGYRYRL